jgi:hypothetical protein
MHFLWRGGGRKLGREDGREGEDERKGQTAVYVLKQYRLCYKIECPVQSCELAVIYP